MNKKKARRAKPPVELIELCGKTQAYHEMDSSVATDTKQVLVSYHDLAGSDATRVLRLPESLVSGRRRGLAFTAASIVSWCKSNGSRTFNPTTAQISSRSGFSVQQTKRHIAKLVSAGAIKRIRFKRKPSETTIDRVFYSHLFEDDYLELPVVVAQLMGGSLPRLNTLARCVMAVVTSRLILTSRLDIEEEEVSVPAMCRRIRAKRFRVLRALDELAGAGIPVETDGRLAWLTYDAEIAYQPSHDTELNWTDPNSAKPP